MMGSSRLGRAGLALAQIILALIILLPFFWMVSVSLKPAGEPFAIPAKLWPDSPTLENYVTAFRPEFKVYFINSMVVSLSTVVITVTLALLAAYTFTRSQARTILICMSLVIAAQMFPASAIIIPIYKLMKDADLLNTYASLVLAYITITLPVAIWMLRAFMARLPVELDEAVKSQARGLPREFGCVAPPVLLRRDSPPAHDGRSPYSDR